MIQNKSPYGFVNLNVLDKAIRFWRSRFVLSQIPGGSNVLDFGCGEDGAFLALLKSSNRLGSGVGIDPIAREGKYDQIELRRGSLEVIRSGEKFDVATMLAVVEHLDDPVEVLTRLRESIRPGGKIVLTAPSFWARPILELLAFRLKIISDFGIRDHKRYYNRASLIETLSKAGYTRIHHRYFQFFMNNLIVAESP